MRSKTSLFKPVLIKTNLKQFWPVSIIYLIVLIFLLPVPLAGILKDYNDDILIINAVANRIAESHIVIFPVFAAAGGAFTCFSYLFSSRSSNMIHAFPLDRNQLYVSNFVSGFILIAVPQVITALLSAPYLIQVGLGGRILPWLLTSLACAFVFYVIAVFSCILAGHALAAMVYYAFFNLAEGLIILLCRSFLQLAGFGLSGISIWGSIKQFFLSPAMFLSDSFYLAWDSSRNPEVLAQSVHYYGLSSLVIYVIVCAFIAVLALFLYKKRRLETVQEMSAFAFMRPLMRWVIAFGVGTAVAMSVEAMGIISFRRFLVLLIIFALLSFFAVEMVLRKSFRIFKKRTVIEAAACAACIAAVFTIMRYDSFGITNKLPDTEKLISAGLYGNVLISSEDKADIEKIRDINQLILDNKSELTQYTNGFSSGTRLVKLSFIYCRENREAVTRNYYVPIGNTEIMEAVNEFEDDPSMVSDFIFGINSDDVEWNSGSIYESTLDEKTAKAVYHAYMKDLEEGNVRWKTGSMDDDYYVKCCYISLSGTITPSIETVHDKLPWSQWIYGSAYFNSVYSFGVDDGSAEQVQSEFSVTADCVHVAKALKDAGIIKDADELDPRVYYDEPQIRG